MVGLFSASNTPAFLKCDGIGLFRLSHKVCESFISLSQVAHLCQVYYFVLIISRFLSCAKDVGRDTTRRFGYIFRMRKMIPTLFRLLRDGTIYFVV